LNREPAGHGWHTLRSLLKNGRSSGQEPTILDLHVLFTGYHSKPVGHP